MELEIQKKTAEELKKEAKLKTILLQRKFKEKEVKMRKDFEKKKEKKIKDTTKKEKDDHEKQITELKQQIKIKKDEFLAFKVVLIDFWASWCGPCRRESPNMVKLYNKFRDKGFEIYSVSLDKDRQAWLNAIKKDKLRWTHVSDLGFWNAKPAQLYNISSIPSTVLLDRNGKIIAKGLMGGELDQKLDEIFVK